VQVVNTKSARQNFQVYHQWWSLLVPNFVFGWDVSDELLFKQFCRVAVDPIRVRDGSIDPHFSPASYSYSSVVILIAPTFIDPVVDRCLLDGMSEIHTKCHGWLEKQLEVLNHHSNA
jgi:hypothetical protein